MAIGLAPSLPLGIDLRIGYSLHEEIIPMVLQNMKMVICFTKESSEMVKFLEMKS